MPITHVVDSLEERRINFQRIAEHELRNVELFLHHFADTAVDEGVRVVRVHLSRCLSIFFCRLQIAFLRD